MNQTLEPFISLEEILLSLNKTDCTPFEEEQLLYLQAMSTQTIISYCGNDPRLDPEQHTEVLGLVAARMIMLWWVEISNNITGIAKQSLGEISMEFVVNPGFDPMTKLMLDRFRSYTIA